MKPAAAKIIDNLPKLTEALAELSRSSVLVGVPVDKAGRREAGAEMNNATLAYIHDNGSPAGNIPARPFMKPGIQGAKNTMNIFFKQAALAATKGNKAAVSQNLNKVGLTAQAGIRGCINEGIAPPLKESTLRGRIRNKTGAKGAKAELAARAEGETGSGNAKPLVATGQLRNSISYVLKRY